VIANLLSTMMNKSKPDTIRMKKFCAINYPSYYSNKTLIYVLTLRPNIESFLRLPLQASSTCP
jgi:hypothetical protein